MLLEILNQIDSMVWGPWLLILLLGTGILFTLRLGFIQIAKLPLALRLIFLLAIVEMEILTVLKHFARHLQQP